MDECVWSFAINDNGVITHRQIAPITVIENARKLFSASIERLWALQAKLGIEKTINFLPQLLSDCQRHLHQLFQLLIHPLEDVLSLHTKLTIAPDGPLYYVPFHALYDGQAYLAENYVIHYVPNATSYLFCEQSSQSKPALGCAALQDDQPRCLLMGCR